MILQLLLPEGVYEVAFEVVRRMLEQRGIPALLPHFRVTLTESIQAFLFGRLDD